MNELDIGELNHGEKFPAKFLPYVTTEQYQGGSYDGQYRHLSVPELLDWSLWMDSLVPTGNYQTGIQ
jgi:hypothetical protein